MNAVAPKIRNLADAMSILGFALAREADSITRAELVTLANSLQANVNVILALVDEMQVESIN